MLFTVSTAFNAMLTPASIRVVVYTVFCFLLCGWLPGVGRRPPWCAVLLNIAVAKLHDLPLAFVSGYFFPKQVAHNIVVFGSVISSEQIAIYEVVALWRLCSITVATTLGFCGRRSYRVTA